MAKLENHGTIIVYIVCGEGRCFHFSDHTKYCLLVGVTYIVLNLSVFVIRSPANLVSSIECLGSLLYLSQH